MAHTKIVLLFLCAPGFLREMEGRWIKKPARPRQCADILGSTGKSRVDTVYADDGSPIQVYCQRSTDGKEAWTVFQHRFDGSVNFFRQWADYQKGFGNLSGEFWLGLEHLSKLTVRRRNEMRIDLVKWDGRKAFATYHDFSVTNSSDFYRLRYGIYVKDVPGSGEPGDSLRYHRGRRFSTINSDHDALRVINCAELYRAGWWYRRCQQANLNAPYYNEKTGLPIPQDGIMWYPYSGVSQALRSTTMKLRHRR